VKVTVWPKRDGFSDEVKVVVLTCRTTCLRLRWLLACVCRAAIDHVDGDVPALKASVKNVATPPLSVPVPSTLVPSLNVTMPVAVPPLAAVTLAVNVTACPNAEGWQTIGVWSWSARG
jgi:hypothetical protein